MRILYIDIDSLRPDHLGCYGYHRNTSPAIDRIAGEALICRNVYASDAPCMPSRTAFYSGRFGIQTGVVGHGGTAAQPKVQGVSRGFRDAFEQQGLAFQLQKLGYHTAMVSPFGQRHAAHWFYAGFHEIHNTGSGGMESAEEIMPTVMKWMHDNAPKDQWYLHINFWDPHAPYRVPAGYGNPFENDRLPEWLDDDNLIRRHNQATGPHTSLDADMYDDREYPEYPRHCGKITDKAGMRKVIDGYDTGVRYVDDQIGAIVECLKMAGVYDDTMIVISADHGENFGELGIYAEHGTADHATCRVPMIIKYPQGVRGESDDGFHYSLDFAPTLMELLGGQKQPLWDGQSYATTILSSESRGREDLVLSQCAHVAQRSVRWGKWLYIRTYHDGFHLFPQEMLFDLDTDPHEQTNLAGRFPEICREGAWRLCRWHDAQMQQMTSTCDDAVDPLWTVIKEGGPFHAYLGRGVGQPKVSGFENYLKRLESTERAEGSEMLRAKYARYLSDSK